MGVGVVVRGGLWTPLQDPFSPGPDLKEPSPEEVGGWVPKPDRAQDAGTPGPSA